MENNQHRELIANRVRNGWFEIVDELDNHVADYRKGELEINPDYPLTSELQKELYLLILTIQD
jgi:hypothetical protein